MFEKENKHMLCNKCKKEMPNGFMLCPFCGFENNSDSIGPGFQKRGSCNERPSAREKTKPSSLLGKIKLPILGKIKPPVLITILLAAAAVIIVVVALISVNSGGVNNEVNATAITDKQFEEFRRAQQEIEDAVDTGLTIPEQLEAAVEIAQKQQQQGLVTSYELYYDSLTVDYSCGITYLYIANYGEYSVMGSAEDRTGDFLGVSGPEINFGESFASPTSGDVYRIIENTGELSSSGISGGDVSLENLKTVLEGK